MEDYKESNLVYILLIVLILIAVVSSFYYINSKTNQSTVTNSNEDTTDSTEDVVDFFGIVSDSRKEAIESPDVILINSEDDYIDFINNCNLYNNYEGITINLMTDIDFEGSEENPTPTFNQEFRGTFNGNGHTFNNVYILKDSYEGAALFKINNGTIKKLIITGFVKSNHAAAAFVDRNYGTILQCVNYAEIQGAYQVGGICAWAGGVDKFGTIKYCINHGNIIDTEPGGGGTIGYGGILGYCYSGEVSYCYSIGNIPREGYHSRSSSNISGWFSTGEDYITKNCFYLSKNEVDKDSEYFNPTTSISSDTVMNFLNQDIKAFKLDAEKGYPVLDMNVDI